MLDVYPIISPELSDARSIPGSSDIQRFKPNRINASFSSAFSQRLSLVIFWLLQSSFQFDTLCTVSLFETFYSRSFWLPTVIFFSHFSWVSVVVPKNYVALSSPSHLEIRRSRISRSYQATFNLFLSIFSPFYSVFSIRKRVLRIRLLLINPLA